MEIIGLFVAVIALVLIGIGFAIGLVGCAMAFVLVGLGVVSSSFVVGLLSGRSSVAFRAFLLQVCILAGIPAGAVCAWIGKTFLAAYGSDLLVIACGAVGGALAGVIIALSLDFISRRFHSWASARFLPTSQSKPLPPPR
jgi:hypothetical protein